MRSPICSSITAIKYLFKHVSKENNITTTTLQDESKIKQCINARYISAPKRCWRLLSFIMHGYSPPVQLLQIHLLNHHHIFCFKRRFGGCGERKPCAKNDAYEVIAAKPKIALA